MRNCVKRFRMPVSDIYGITRRVCDRAHNKIRNIGLQFILELLRCSRYYVPWCITYVGTIIYAPIAIPGNLASNTANSIGYHKGRCCGIGEMQDTYPFIMSIYADGYCGANETTIKS